MVLIKYALGVLFLLTLPAYGQTTSMESEVMHFDYIMSMGGGPTPDQRAADTPATQIDKVQKLAGDLAAKYPKCHFRVASIGPANNAGSSGPPTPSGGASRVSFIGDKDCLTAK